MTQEAIEVEVKIPVRSCEDVFGRLERAGFKRTGIHEETDTYYNSAWYDLREHDKALRIRRVKDLTDRHAWAELNCKGPKLDHVSVSRRETEMILEHPDKMEQILEELGFFPTEITVKKTRFYFRRGRITASVDRVEGLGDFLELEIVENGEKKRQECLNEIEMVMQEIGYGMENTIRTSYLSLLQKKSGAAV